MVKTKGVNLQLKEKTEFSWRALKKDKLGAVILGCKHHTIMECLKKELFGLPAPHYEYVKNVTAGLTLYLFNYSDRRLHGIFEAVSCGKMNINPLAWITSEGCQLTPYPAQVQIREQRKCIPLLEAQFKPIIAENYYTENLFWFELDKGQNKRLMTLFLSSPLPEKMPVLEKKSHPPKTTNKNMFNVLSSSSLNDISDEESENLDSEEFSEMRLKENEHSSASANNRDYLAPEIKRTDLFGPSLSSVKNEEVLECQRVRLSSPISDCFDMEQKITPSSEQRSKQPSEVLNLARIMKLMQEVQGLKVSQLNQCLKIESLEHELVLSKLEIDRLKKSCHKLECKASCASDNCNIEDRSISCFANEESVFIVGGFDGHSWLPDLSLYSPCQDHVTSLCSMSSTRIYAAMAKLNRELYIFGGNLDGVLCDTVESYNPSSNQWSQRPSLKRKKRSPAGASIHDKIYSIGGGNGFECFSEVELFDLNIGSWTSTQSMLEKRFSPAAADMNGALYVAGGYDGNHFLRSVERLDPRESAWTSLEGMNETRGYHSLVAFKEKLYALGGYNGDAMLSSVEVFDPRIGLWMMGEPMRAVRAHFGSFVLEGKMHVIGGVHDNEVLEGMECYEEGSSGWQAIGTTALGKISFCSALVL